MKVSSKCGSPQPSWVRNGKKTPPLRPHSSIRSSRDVATSTTTPIEHYSPPVLNPQYFEQKIELLRQRQRQMEEFFSIKIQSISRKITKRDEANSLLKSQILHAKKSLDQKRRDLKLLKSVLKQNHPPLQNHSKPPSTKPPLPGSKLLQQTLLNNSKPRIKSKHKSRPMKFSQTKNKLQSCRSLF